MDQQTRTTVFERLTESSMYASLGHGRITRFRQMTMEGPPAASGALFEKMTTLPLEMEQSETELMKETRLRLAKKAVSDIIDDVQASIDAAAFVFAHSILDDFTSECCRISVECDSDRWLVAIDQRKVSIGEIRSCSPTDLVERLLRKYVDELAREPLLKRVDTLFGKCQPLAPFVLKVKPYTFDRVRLKALDKLRHDVIHQPTKKQTFESIEDDLLFLHWTCDFCAWIVAKKYGLELDNPMMPSLASGE